MKKNIFINILVAAALLGAMTLSLGCNKKHIHSTPPATRGDSVKVEQQTVTQQKVVVEHADLPEETVIENKTVVVESASAGTFEQRGMASWISEELQGMPTASGELYDVNSYTAAHRTIPLGTRLEVTRIDTGKKVVVVVNDRGPFKKDRIIDLSRRAARDLDMLGSGVTEVGIRRVGHSPVATQPKPAPTQKAPEQVVVGNYYVQVGAFVSKENADASLTHLIADGYRDSRVVKKPGDDYYRVQAGRFKNDSEARQALNVLQLEYPSSFLLKD